MRGGRRPLDEPFEDALGRAYTCFCNEKHWSKPDSEKECAADLLRCNRGTCLQGRCPSSGGLFCSGNGHKRLGEGYEPNADARRGDHCELVCAPGFVNCRSIGLSEEDKCVKERPHVSFTTLCGREEDCPPSSPIRCPSGDCAAVPTSSLDARQTLGYVDGSLEKARSSSVTSRRAARVGLLSLSSTAAALEIFPSKTASSLRRRATTSCTPRRAAS